MQKQLSEKQERQQRARVEKKAKLVKLLDMSSTHGCQFLVRSFRELDKIVNKPYKYCSNSHEIFQQCQLEPKQLENKDQAGTNTKPIEQKYMYNIVDQILQRGRVLQPYINIDLMQEPPQLQPIQFVQRPEQSIMGDTLHYANRQCYEPKIKIDGQLIFEYQNSTMNKLKKDHNTEIRYKNSMFIITVEVESNCIIYLTKNGKHPLLAQGAQREIHKIYEDKLQPPCSISVVAVNPEFRMASRVLTVIVKKSLNVTNSKETNPYESQIVRPGMGSQLDDMLNSRSNYSQFHYY